MKYPDDLYYPALRMTLKKLLSLHRHCDECGCLETADNILLYYDCGKLLCDKCFVKVYHIKLD